MLMSTAGQRLTTEKGESDDLVGAMKAGERAELNSDDDED